MKRCVFSLIVLSFLLYGCETLPWRKETKESTKAPTPMLNQVYYGFPDIPIPKELTFDSDKSFIYETGGIKTGVLTFGGNVDVESLKNYFKTNMVKNGWKLINSFEFRNVVLNFIKEDKSCNVHISRGAFTTEVTIWIGPVEKSFKEKNADLK